MMRYFRIVKNNFKDIYELVLCVVNIMKKELTKQIVKFLFYYNSVVQ